MNNMKSTFASPSIGYETVNSSCSGGPLGKCRCAMDMAGAEARGEGEGIVMISICQQQDNFISNCGYNSGYGNCLCVCVYLCFFKGKA